jgi:hypothetical protein
MRQKWSAADDIHDVMFLLYLLLLPSLILTVSLLQLASLHAAGGFTTFASISAFADVYIVSADLLLSACCCERSFY